MSEDKDDLKSVKVYKLSNTKESWHEFATIFRVIAGGLRKLLMAPRVYLMKRKKLEILEKDDEKTRKSKK